MGYREHASSEFIARGNRQKYSNIATRIAELQVDIVQPYVRVAFIGVHYGASGDGRGTART